MSPRQQYALIAGCYGIFLLITLPAHWAGALLARYSNAQLLGATGTLWQGRAAALQIGTHTFPDFVWDLHTLPLLWGNAQADLRWGEQSHTLATASFNQWQLQHADVRLPVTWLREFLPDAQKYALGGEIRLQTERLIWRGKFDGKAQLTWYNASTVQLPVQPLGDYQLDTQGDAKGIVSHIRTLQGALTITGTLRRAHGDRLRFAGTLQPDPARQAEFGSLIQLTGGQPDAQGAYRLGF